MKCTMRKKFTMWRPPRFRPFPPAFNPEAIAVGANVRTRRAVGQIWCQSRRPKCWWIATVGQRFVEAHESEITVLGQCYDQQQARIHAA